MPGRTKTDTTGPVKDQNQLKNLLLVLEHARADAWLRKDREALEPLLAPDFMEINYFGRLNKDDLLIRFFPKISLHTFTIEGPALRIVSDTAVFLTYECYEELTVEGKKMKGTFSVSALYTWNTRQWKLALWQITPFCGR